jgi:integrase
VTGDAIRRIPLIVKLVDWPPQDRSLWLAGLQPSDGLDDAQHAETLSPLSIVAARRGYGRYLAYLIDAGICHSHETGAARITPSRMAGYVKALQANRNVNTSVKMRVFELRMATRIMDPDADLNWLTRPDGRSLDTIFPSEPKAITPPHPRDILASGLALIDEATEQIDSIGITCHAAERLRDGLLIGVLATLALRVRTLSEMRLGRQLRRIGEVWWLCFEPDDLKNGRRLEFELPSQLASAIDVYLDTARPFFLRGGSCNAVWLTRSASAYSIAGIATMIGRRYARGETCISGPHLSRHALATGIAAAEPHNPGLAASVLGVSDFVVQKHYDRARQVDAARHLTADLQAEREQTRQVAERAFGVRLGQTR